MQRTIAEYQRVLEWNEQALEKRALATTSDPEPWLNTNVLEMVPPAPTPAAEQNAVACAL